MLRPRVLLSLALGLALFGGAACGEEHYYSVGLDGTAIRVDENGVPLPDQAQPRGAAPAQDDPHAGASDAPADGPITGTIELDPSLGVDPAQFKCVFLTARRAADGRMDGVVQFTQPSFPIAFTLAAADASHGGGLTSGAHFLIAHLDADGDAGTTAVGDVVGVVQGVLPGGPPVVVALDDLLTPDEMGATQPAPAPPSPPVAGSAAETPAPADLAGPRFRGRVELAPEFAALNGKHKLFLILRNPRSEGGMPLAVKAIPDASFPLEFDIGTEAVPLAVDNKDEMLQGEVKVFARLSVAGGPAGGGGDIESEPVITSAGPSPIALTLSKRRSP